jgi:alpha-N-acetylglucosaminidase
MASLPHVILLLLLLLGAASASSSSDTASALEAVALRTFNMSSAVASRFQFRILSPAVGVPDYYELSCVKSASADVCAFINIIAMSGPAAGAGLHHYMRETLNASVTWGVGRSGYHVDVASLEGLIQATGGLPPPTVNGRVSLASVRYHMNVCTLGYSTAFWTWPEWEQHIDWMILHGINLPLATEGAEYVWWRTYTERFNLTSDDVVSYFTGVAFLPWNRMGNIHTWAGPMSVDFLKARADLQKLLLGRMRELGISPVLPAFDGHVPTALKAQYPNANITRSADWLGNGAIYSENLLLNPTDPLFARIASAFAEIQREEFGDASFYNADTWNEMNPASGDHTYLADTARAVYNGLTTINPNATWVMQGWTFYEQSDFWSLDRIQAYLGGVPQNGLLILDLTSESFPQYERTQGYFGYPFVWCMLHNYGGKRGIYGNASHIAAVPRMELISAKYPSLVGIGITMEAIEQNEMLYELMLDTPWASFPSESSSSASSSSSGSWPLPDEITVAPIDLPSWLQVYTTARYGPDASAAARDVFGGLTTGDGPMTAFIGCCYFFSSAFDRPWLSPPTRDGSTVWTGYNADRIVAAARTMADALENAPGDIASPLRSALRYDAVDMTRQLLENIFTDLHGGLWAVLNRTDVTAVDVTDGIASTMLTLLSDLDELLSTDANFMLGTWLSGADRWAEAIGQGSGGPMRDQLRYNALLQVSLWGPKSDRVNIHDYAVKPWAGLIEKYALRRWELFFLRVLDVYPTAGGDGNFTMNHSSVAEFITDNAEWPFVLNVNQTYATVPIVRDTAMRVRDAVNFYATSMEEGVNVLVQGNTTVSTAGALLFTTWHRDPQVMYTICEAIVVCVAFTPSTGALWRSAGDVAPSEETLYVLQWEKM